MLARLPATLLLTGLALTSAQGVVLFQLETFDGPTGWTAGSPHPSPPSIQPDSGPLGTGDSSLVINAAPGSGAGSRLATYNRTDWTGDYLGAGISALTMDLRNQSPNASQIRVGLNGPGGWFVTEAQPLGVFSTWTSVEFDLTADSLLSAGGGDARATLAGVTELRILHNADVDFRGGPGQRTLRVDNLFAVPEPEIPLLAGLGAVFLCRRRR